MTQIRNLCQGLPVAFVPEQWRTYRLVKLTGRLPSELGEESAHELDYLLAIEETVAEIKRGH